MRETAHIRIGRHRIGRFRFLLVAIVLMFALRPFLEGYAGVGVLTDIFFSLVLLSGAYAFSDQGGTFFATLVFVFTALVLAVISYFIASEPVEVIKRIFVAVFFAYVLAIMLSRVFREREVTEDLITGAICVYFLIGMVWAFVFYFMALANEGSFSNVTAVSGDMQPFMYFSFVTLATLGYGDIVPLTAPARSLTVLEAVTGQLYLAVTIARLIGISSSKTSLPQA